MAKPQKPLLTVDHLLKCGAKIIAYKTPKGALIDSKSDLLGDPVPPSFDVSTQGFYFFVNDNGEVDVRFFIGRQRSKCGLEAVVRHMRSGRSEVCKKMIDCNTLHKVYYIPSEKMKPLTTAAHKGTIATLCTRAHNSRYQNLEEMNRLVNDNFKFNFQRH